MDTQITIWEMSMEPDQHPDTREEIATWPSEPYHLDRGMINPN